MKTNNVVRIQKPKPAIPASIFAQHLAILGKTGSGKTVTAKGFVEWMLATGQGVCVIDPTDVWWGIRSQADGKSAAYPVVVFGGKYADMPLLPSQGKVLAEIVGNTDIQAIIVTKQMTVGERTRFFTDFAEEIMRSNNRTLHLVIDEAHNFMPQGKVLSPQAGAMLAAGNELLSGGRAAGLRIMLVSQRPQKLHKDSLTQAETLIAMRLIAPHDRKAVAEWMKAQAEDEAHATKILNSLPGLKTGEGWAWSPEIPLLKQIQFPMISTYDSSKPQSGKERKIVLAKADLPAIQSKLEVFAKEAQSNDPKALKAQVARLEAELKKKPAAAPVVKGYTKADVELAFKEGFKAGETRMHEIHMKGWDEIHTQLANIRAKQKSKIHIEARIADLMPAHMRPAAEKAINRDRGYKESPPANEAERIERLQAIKPVLSLAQQSRHDRGKMRESGEVPKNFSPMKMNPGSNGMGGSERKILIALANYPEGKTKRELGVIAGYAWKGGSFNTYLSGLRSKGYAVGTDRMSITPAGLEALGDFEPLPTGRALQDYWLGQLSKGEAAILKALIDAYPQPLSKAQAGEITGYNAAGGSFNTYCSKLRTLDLIQGSNPMLAAETLFDGAE